MTKLLISVKNIEEATIAFGAGADFIDLKDPEQGALGSLNFTDTLAIVNALQDKILLSATIGDEHGCWHAQLAIIEEKIALGLRMIKLPVVETYLLQQPYLDALKHLLALHPVKLIGVFFAENLVSIQCIHQLAEIGFYGAMLDTQHKNHHLLSVLSSETIKNFVKLCKTNQLEVGLAGALRIEYLDTLLEYEAGYVGFRSGVCQAASRKNSLLAHKVKEISEKLYKHNSLCVKLST